MDRHNQRILSFLKKNTTLDLEVPDIAFHLKLDEGLVQGALNGLYHDGMVTARQNEYGRVYWYSSAQAHEMTSDAAVPSSPVAFHEPAAPKKLDLDKLEALSGSHKFPLLETILVLAVLLAVGFGGFFGVQYVEKRLAASTAALKAEMKKELVPAAEYRQFKERAIVKVDRLEADQKILLGKVDSLQLVITTIEQAQSKAAVVKTASSRTIKRK